MHSYLTAKSLIQMRMRQTSPRAFLINRGTWCKSLCVVYLQVLKK